MTIKNKAYEVLKKLGGRATEGELVEQYIKMHPDYNKNYTETKIKDKAKIRGTLNAVLIIIPLHTRK